MACVCSEGDLGHAGASEAQQTNKPFVLPRSGSGLAGKVQTVLEET